MFEVDDGERRTEFADSLLGKSATSTEVERDHDELQPAGARGRDQGRLSAGRQRVAGSRVDRAREGRFAGRRSGGAGGAGGAARGASRRRLHLTGAGLGGPAATAARPSTPSSTPPPPRAPPPRSSSTTRASGSPCAASSIRTRSESDPGFFAALPPYEPTLTEEVRGDALVYLGVGDPGASGAALVGRAASTAPDLFRGLKQFQRRLRRRDKIDVERDLLPLLEGEAALTVEPAKGPGAARARQPETPGRGRRRPGCPIWRCSPRASTCEAALEDLAELQVPISRRGRHPMPGRRRSSRPARSVASRPRACGSRGSSISPMRATRIS